MKTILETHLDTWTATTEQHEDNLRRCLPDNEKRHGDLMNAAYGVVKALREYDMVVKREGIYSA